MGLINQAFILPFQNRQLLIIYLSLIAGMFAASFLGIYVAIDMVRLGYWGVVTYLEAWLGLLGLVFFPFYFYTYAHMSRRNFIALVLGVQLIGSVLMVVVDLRNSPFTIGLLMAMFSTGFWQMYHLNMAAHSSDHSRGYEVSLGKAVARIGSILGAGSAGFLLSGGAPVQVIIMALFFQFIATVGLAITTPTGQHSAETDPSADQGNVSIEKFRHMFTAYPRQNIGVALEALVEQFTSIMIPVWLTLAGISALAIGLVRVLAALVTVFIVPLCGRLVHQKKGDEFKQATITFTLGWAPFFFAMTAPMLAWATIAWTIAGNFFSSGLESRRYSKRSATLVFVREIYLTLTRIPAIPITAWLAFYHPMAFAIVGALVTAAVWPYGLWLARSEREGGV